MRKYVVVLFVDLVGSTSLAERTDPELLRTVLARYFEVVSAAIRHHGGSVEKFIGDAVMAVFGVPRSNEDDPHRAVLAAAEAVAGVARLGEEVRAELGVGLTARAGVNGGDVFVTRHPDGQLAVTGDAVNVAQRLEAQAPPGGVLLGATVGATVRDRCTIRSLGPVRHRGRADAEEAFLLVDAGRGGQRAPATFAGRDRELRDLRRLRAECVTRSRGSRCTIVGPPGSGKSRLAAELGGAGELLSLTCRPDRTATFDVITDLVEQLPGRWRDRLRATLPRRAGAVEELLAQLRVGSDVVTTPADVVAAVHAAIRAASYDGPLVLVWDDLHAATEHQLELIAALADAVVDDPVVTILLTRPALFERHPRWGGGRRSHVVDLDPLTDDAIAAVLASGTGGTGSAPVAAIVARSQGNPALALALAQWRGAADRLPTSAQLVLTAVVESLAPAVRETCQTAAVLGDGFAVDELAVASCLDVAAVEASVVALRAQDIVEPVPSREAEPRFRFAHRLLQDTAREMVPKGRRADIHLRAAGHLGADVVRADRALHHYDLALRAAREAGTAAALAERAAPAVLELRQQRIRDLAAAGDPRLSEELVRQAEQLPPGDDRALLVLFHLLTVPASEVAASGEVESRVRSMIERCSDGSRRSELDQVVGRILALRGGRVRPTDLLAEADVHEAAVADRDAPAGLRLLHLLHLGQVFAATECFSSCREVASRGLAIAEEIGEVAIARLFRGLELQMAFVVPERFATTVDLAERHLAAVAGSAHEVAKTNAVLAAAYAYVGAADAAAQAWDAVLAATPPLDPEDLVVARQYNALRIEVTQSSAAAAEEWEDLARCTTNPQRALHFRAAAAEAYLRAGLLGPAREQRRRCAGHDEDEVARRFALLTAIEAALDTDLEGMRAGLERLDHLDGTETSSVDAALATLGRAMAHAAAGDGTTAGGLLAQAQLALVAKGAVALAAVAGAALAAADALRSSAEATR